MPHRPNLCSLSLVAAAVAFGLTSTASRADGAGDQGFSAARLGRIQSMMDQAIHDGRIPSGIAMVARNGEVVWLGTAGEMGPGVPMRNDPIIPLASVGKLHTATAAMILFERGAISLDDPLSKYVPEFADVKIEVTNDSGESELAVPREPVTIYHLLTHTGGLQVTGDRFQRAWDTHTGRTTTTALAREMASIPLQSQPGTRFEYGWGGSSYEVLGAVIEIASGQTLEAFMTDHIFKPLGLNDSYFYTPQNKSERMPAFHRKVDGVLNQDRAHGEDFPRSTYFHGGGGVRSSPADILRFARLFLEGGTVDGVQILSPKTVQLMMTDHLGEISPWPGGEYSWGFGGSVRNFVRGSGLGSAGQFGWAGGGYATLWVDPREKLVAYFAFPVMPPGDFALLQDFKRLVYTAMSESYVD